MNAMISCLAVLLTTAVLLISSGTSAKQVHDCSCHRNGNKYLQLAENGCEKFTQYDNMTRLTHTHSCPPGLRFSVESCVCEHSRKVACEGCGPPVCEIDYDEEFEEVLDLQIAGECQRAEEVSQTILEKCVINNPVAGTLFILSAISARERETQCPPPTVAEGCEQLSFCMTLMLAPKDKRNKEKEKPKFLCENYKEAMNCLRCVEANGCKFAERTKNDLRVAAAELCPHIQEFACPADVQTTGDILQTLP